MGKRKGEEEGKCDCRERRAGRDGFLQFDKLPTYTLRYRHFEHTLTEIFRTHFISSWTFSNTFHKKLFHETGPKSRREK